VKRLRPINLKNIKTRPLAKRRSKVRASELSVLPEKGGSFNSFMASLPDILAAKDLKAVIAAIVKAHKAKKTVALGIGAHVIKTGLSPIIIDLMERGVVSSIATNGACIVHDFELAFAGKTSEDVDKEIESGAFGMAEETGSFLNKAIKQGVKKGYGIGRSVGEMIESSKFPNRDKSLFAAAARLGIPATVHVAIGTDIIHMHPSMDGAATGKGSEIDFRLFASVVSTLKQGVYINLGSAVLLPEVFLKALTLSRNLAGGRGKVNNFTTVNMDFIQHYRAVTNVVRRPTLGSGKGYTLTGHHEIMLPLLYAGIIEGI
jgi:hypothetical protein